MFGKLLPYLGNYKKYAVLTPIMVIGEVILEIFLPLIMSKIIDVVIKNGDYGYVVQMSFDGFNGFVCTYIGGAVRAVCGSCRHGLCQGIAKKAF